MLKTGYIEGIDIDSEAEEERRVTVEISSVCGDCFRLKMFWDEEDSYTSEASVSSTSS